MTNSAARVLQMMHRVVADNRVELFGERAALDVVDEKPATDRRFMIDRWRQRPNSVARNFDQVQTDIDAGNIVADACEIFAQPARTTGGVEDASAGGKIERDRHVREITTLPVRFDIHAVAATFWHLVR